MKISERWLREHANPDVDAQALADRLSLAGLEGEIESMLSAVPSGVLVGRIDEIGPHPQADRLRICQVNTGDAKHEIVCGAANARAGLVAPVALLGAVLPSGMKIKPAKLRGVPSNGMLCSAAELGLAEKSDGLMELPADTPLGQDVVELLQLDDRILELELTPNRGDCLSLRGLAREVGAVFGVEVELPGATMPEIDVGDAPAIAVRVLDQQACTAYHGRVVAGIDPAARTPLWMVERLRRAGIRAIHPVVDITNYVMIELGQPMHGFDCARLQGGISVRAARSGEQIELLNEQKVTLNDAELVIADDTGPLALAGVMGGEHSGVDSGTTDIFLESARFSPAAVAGTGRRHKLHSDSLHRFERDVDPELQALALARATQLVLEICGGTAGPISEVRADASAQPVVTLRKARLQRLLGVDIADEEVERLLTALGLDLAREDQQWQVRVPSWRPDLRIEPDLIEEVARLYGYSRISAAPYAAHLAPPIKPERQLPADRLRDALAAKGWQEIVSYAFVEPRQQQQLLPDQEGIPLDNPLAETMAVMRTQLFGGLINAWQHNAQRQNRRVRLFEFGVCFAKQGASIVEDQRLAGLAAGSAEPAHWDSKPRAVDFYDLKGDLQRLMGQALDAEAAEHPALHPGKTARLSVNGTALGWLGQLHPRLVRTLDLPEAPWLFELDGLRVAERAVPQAQPVSEFPASRRDLALVVPESVSAAALQQAAKQGAGPALQAVRVFDVYRGKGLPDGCKSVALGLIFQDYSRTLKDQEVEDAVRATSDRLAEELGATLRG